MVPSTRSIYSSSFRSLTQFILENFCLIMPLHRESRFSEDWVLNHSRKKALSPPDSRHAFAALPLLLSTSTHAISALTVVKSTWDLCPAKSPLQMLQFQRFVSFRKQAGTSLQHKLGEAQGSGFVCKFLIHSEVIHLSRTSDRAWLKTVLSAWLISFS